MSKKAHSLPIAVAVGHGDDILVEQPILGLDPVDVVRAEVVGTTASVRVHVSRQHGVVALGIVRVAAPEGAGHDEEVVDGPTRPMFFRVFFRFSFAVFF